MAWFQVGSQAQLSGLVMEQVKADAEQAKVFDEVAALKDVPHPGAGFGQSWRMGEQDRCVHERGDDDDSADPCGAAAEAAYDDCIADGGSEEQCREAAADAYDDCDRG